MNGSAWLLYLAVGLLTYFTRVAMLLAGRAANIEGSLRTWLTLLPLSILTLLAVLLLGDTMIAFPSGIPGVAVGLAVVVSASRVRSLPIVVVVLAGIAVAALWFR